MCWPQAPLGECPSSRCVQQQLGGPWPRLAELISGFQPFLTKCFSEIYSPCSWMAVCLPAVSEQQLPFQKKLLYCITHQSVCSISFSPCLGKVHAAEGKPCSPKLRWHFSLPRMEKLALLFKKQLSLSRQKVLESIFCFSFFSPVCFHIL